MKLALRLLTLALCVLFASQWYPGQRFNRHVWFGDIANASPTANDIAVFEGCRNRGDDGQYKLCIDPRTYHVFAVRLIVDVGPNKGCWNVDYCVRHGEAKVTPCK